MGQEEQAPAEILTTRDLLQQRLTAIQKEMDALPLDQTGQARFQVLMAQYAQIAAMIRGQMPVDMGVLNQGQQAGGQSQTPVVVGPTTPMLLSVLAELSKQTNTKIAVDLTVKDEPIPMGAASVQGLPMNLALDTILKATKRSYIYRTLPDGTYQIFHPITNTFIAQDLVTALADIAAEAEVGITPDPNVAGTTSADFKEQPLEGALSRVLAGTGFVFRRMDDYYLVGDRSPDSPSYPDISVTQFVKTNHTLPVTIKNLLPEQYQLYVKAEAASTTDPNDQGHFLTVTAPQSLSDKIMHMIKNLDVSRRQILLDARVVTMERGNELNLGVEWGFPTMNAGLFYDGDTTSKGVQIGYSVDQTFTNSLMATLNLLEATNQADIVAHPQLVAQDGSQAQLRTIQEEWFMMTANQFANNPYGYVNSELQKVESGTVITITPYIGDGNEITLKMAIEVSDSIPRGAASDLPIVTRRQAKNEVTVKNGGTVAVAGLTETRGRNVEKRVPFLGNLPLIGAAFRNKDDLKSTREVAVFVTASLVDGSDLTRMKNQSPDTAIGAGAGVTPSGIRSQPQPSQGMTREDLAAALQRTQ